MAHVIGDEDYDDCLAQSVDIFEQESEKSNQSNSEQKIPETASEDVPANTTGSFGNIFGSEIYTQVFNQIHEIINFQKFHR